MAQREFSAGTVIFREGESGATMYVIRRGCVGIFINYGGSQEKKLTELVSGQCFGEMGVIESDLRSATAVALEYTEVDEVAGDEIEAYFKEHPDQMMRLMRQFSSRLRSLTQKYIDACGTIEEMEKNSARTPGLLRRIEQFIFDYNEGLKRFRKPSH